MTELDTLEVAALAATLERDREDRFLSSLSEDNRAFVVESDKKRNHLMRCLQSMMIEKDQYQRRLASEWVAENAVDVAERNAVVMSMRIQFAHIDPAPLRFPVTP